MGSGPEWWYHEEERRRKVLLSERIAAQEKRWLSYLGERLAEILSEVYDSSQLRLRYERARKDFEFQERQAELVKKALER